MNSLSLSKCISFDIRIKKKRKTVMSFKKPVLATAWISILFLLYLNLEVLMTGTPNEGHIVYQNKDNKYHNRTLKNNLKLGINNNIDNSSLENHNLNKGSIDELLDNSGGSLSQYELLFKSELKSDKHEKGRTTENGNSITKNKPETRFVKNQIPDFKQEDKIASSKSSTENIQQKLDSLKEMPLLETLGDMIGGQVAQGSSSKLVKGVLNLLSPAESDTKMSSNGLWKNAIGLLDPKSITANIVSNYVESKLSETPFLKGLFGNKNYKSSSVLGSKEANEKGSGSSIIGNAGGLVDSLFGSSYMKDTMKKFRQGWDELFFAIQPPSLGIHEEVQPEGSNLEPHEEVVESGNSQQPNLLQEEEQELNGCNCMRRLPVKSELGYTILRRKGTKGEILTRTIPRLSTCSNTATLRGPQQKVISYTYYGDISDPGINNRYFSEIKNRAEEVAKLYPGWVMRVYHNISVSNIQGQQQLCEVACQQPHVDLCSIFNLPSPWGDISHRLETATLWRFLPLLDPLVDIMVSRDLDSYILKREVAAVTEWIASSRLYHAMRDHPLHGTPILAGLWGAHVSLDRAEVYQSIATLLSQVTNHDWGYDQFLLRKVLWPTAQTNVLVHDSYFCDFPNMSGQHPAAGFPTQRDGLNYTGFGKTKMSVTKLLQPCPLQCRPSDHKDWKLC